MTKNLSFFYLPGNTFRVTSLFKYDIINLHYQAGGLTNEIRIF